MANNELQHRYREATTAFMERASNVSVELLDRHEPGVWSARQVIHHMADSEAQGYARLRRLLAEPAGSLIVGYDEAAWANCSTLGYLELPVDEALAVIAAVRNSTAILLGRLSDADLARYGEHTESGLYGVTDWIRIYTAHPYEHLAQLEAALTA